MGKFENTYKKHEHLLDYRISSAEELMEQFNFFKKKGDKKDSDEKDDNEPKKGKFPFIKSKDDDKSKDKTEKTDIKSKSKSKSKDDNSKEDEDDDKEDNKPLVDPNKPKQSPNKIKVNKKHSLKSISGENASLIFGRFSPPTLGHKALIDSVKYDGPVILCIINGVSTKNRKEKDENGNLKNPFSFKTKLQVIESWNDDNIYVIQYTGRAFLPNIIKSIYNKYKIRIKNVIMGEETKSFKQQLVTAIESGDTLFRNVTINSVQRTAGYSGTAARKALVDKNMEEFAKLTGLSPDTHQALIDELSQEVNYVLDQPNDLPVNTITNDQDLSLMTTDNVMPDMDINLNNIEPNSGSPEDEDLSLSGDSEENTDEDVSLEDKPK